MINGGKIGLFGGSFNPVHNGHLILAERARDFAGLDKVYFIPTAIPPHKPQEGLTGLDSRRKMVELAIDDNDHFELSDFEMREETSYTYESVLYFRDKGYDREHLHLIVGTDSLVEMKDWKNPGIIFENCTVIALQRDQERVYDGNLGDAALIVLSSGRNSISSTEIRRFVREGRSIRYLVPSKVEQFILDHSLYAGD